MTGQIRDKYEIGIKNGMVLLIDIGNQRVKWALDDQLLDQVEYRDQNIRIDAADFSAQIMQQFKRLPAPDSVAISAVSDSVVQDKIARTCETLWQVSPIYVRSGRTSVGVINNYLQSDQLGVDRWAALAGAWNEYGRCPIIVIDAGTAVTIDLLNGAGEFVGGIIFPGINTMVCSLSRSTEQIRIKQSSSLDALICLQNLQTGSAVTNGALNAVVGGVDRAINQHKSFIDEDIKTIISGGDAEVIKKNSVHEMKVDAKLVLRGILLLSNEVIG